MLHTVTTFLPCPPVYEDGPDIRITFKVVPGHNGVFSQSRPQRNEPPRESSAEFVSATLEGEPITDRDMLEWCETWVDFHQDKCFAAARLSN